MPGARTADINRAHREKARAERPQELRADDSERGASGFCSQEERFFDAPARLPEQRGRQNKSGAALKAAPLLTKASGLRSRIGSAHELQWNFLPRDKCVTKITGTPHSLASSIKAGTVEVKKKKFWVRGSDAMHSLRGQNFFVLRSQRKKLRAFCG
jgi:hypothetical protein